MKRILLLLTCVLLLAGCRGTGVQVTPPLQPDATPVTVGDQPRHTDPAQCDAPARQVIDKRLTLINRCTSEPVKLADGRDAHYVLIFHGPGGDCPSGCIYQRTAAIVIGERIAILPEPFPDDHLIRTAIVNQLGVSIPMDLRTISDRRFAEQGGRWQLVLSFRHLLKGTVVVNTTDQAAGVELHATADGALSAEQAKAAAWQQWLSQCQPPAGARQLAADVAVTDEGGWRGALVWNAGQASGKVAYVASATGAVTFAQGCR